MSTRQVNLRVDDKEEERLNVVAEHYGLTAQQTLRMLLKREYDAIATKKSKAAHQHTCSRCQTKWDCPSRASTCAAVKYPVPVMCAACANHTPVKPRRASNR